MSITRSENLRLHTDYKRTCRSCEFWAAPESRPVMESFACLAHQKSGKPKTTATDECLYWKALDPVMEKALAYIEFKVPNADQRTKVLRTVFRTVQHLEKEGPFTGPLRPIVDQFIEELREES